MWLWILIAVIVVIVLWIVSTYNSLVGLRNTCKEAFSTMDVYLKKRWDLIPNLVETEGCDNYVAMDINSCNSSYCTLDSIPSLTVVH